MAPRCEHCAYDLAGIAVHGFHATCPECGQSSDVRHMPKPVFPWWHTPGAVLAGSSAYAATILVYVAWWQWYMHAPGKAYPWVFILVAPSVALSIMVLLLRRDYAQRWRYQYGPKPWPRKAWTSLAIDWGIWWVLMLIIPPMLIWAVLALIT